jgi:hypothetical protein
VTVSLSPFAGAAAPARRTLVDRLAQRPRPDLALPALEYLLSARRPAAVTSTEISRVLEEYGVRGNATRALLLELWQRALAEFLSDDALADEEIAYLEELRRALVLGEDEVAEAQARLVHPRYQRALAEVVADDHVSAEERERLARLSAALRLEPEVERELFRTALRPVLQRFLDGAIADRKLSEEERHQFVELMGHLGVAIPPEVVTLRMLTYYALIWRIENGELPVIGSPLALERGEACHLYVPAGWYDPIADAPEAASGDQRLDEYIRVARGLRYRVGSVAAAPSVRPALPGVRQGTLYVTSERVVFQGPGVFAAVPHDEIEGIGVLFDALILESAGGRRRRAVMDETVELTALTLSRVLAER